MPISPPRPKGPPLNALRAFEAAARLGGFTHAAEELGVTPGAIAQHIKALEAWAGADLFERRSRGVVLSPLGKSVLGRFTEAFDRLGEAVQVLRAKALPKDVRIAALPSIAQLWLSPRLPAVRELVPGAGISVTALETPPNLRREPFDMAIFYAARPLGVGGIEVCGDVIFPVCAPEVAKVIRGPEDLDRVPLLHDSAWSDDWPAWGRAFAGDSGPYTSGPVYSLYALAVEEAKNGAGVLMGHEALVQEHLCNGTLVAPFSGRLQLDRALCVALAPTSPVNPFVMEVARHLTRDTS